MSKNCSIIILNINNSPEKNMPNSSHFEQLLTIYQVLPRKPATAISINEIMNKPSVKQACYTGNIESMRRKVHRHLQSLKEVLKSDLIVDKSVSHQHVYLLSEHATIDKSVIPPVLTTLLSKDYLQRILPKSEFQNMQWLFDSAQQQMDKDSELKRLYQSIHAISHELDSRGVKPGIQDVIYQSLSQEMPVKVSYPAKDGKSIREHRGYPLKLVIQPKQQLFIIENVKYKGTLTFSLSDIIDIEIIDKISEMPDRVNIDINEVSENIERHIQPLFSSESMDLNILITQDGEHLIKSHLFNNPLFNKVIFESVVQDGETYLAVKDLYITQAMAEFFVVNARFFVIVEPTSLTSYIEEQLSLGLNNYLEFSFNDNSDERDEDCDSEDFDSDDYDEDYSTYEYALSEFISDENDVDSNFMTQNDVYLLSDKGSQVLEKRKRALIEFWKYLDYYQPPVNWATDLCYQFVMVDFCMFNLQMIVDSFMLIVTEYPEEWEGMLYKQSESFYEYIDTSDSVFINILEFQNHYDDVDIGNWLKAKIQYLMILIYYKGLSQSAGQREGMILELREILKSPNNEEGELIKN